MLRATMENVLRWFTRNVHSLYAGRNAAMAHGTFEHVNSARLDASDFFASDSMGLRSIGGVDFAETMPAYAHSMPQGRRSINTGSRRFA